MSGCEKQMCCYPSCWCDVPLAKSSSGDKHWSGNADGLAALLEENKRLKELAERQMNDAEEAREEVLRFAVLMERELKANDHKGHWSDCGMGYLLKRIREEVDELVHAVLAKSGPDEIASEAADVANFAMMIADNEKALPTGPLTPSAMRSTSGPLKLDTDSQVFFYEQDHYYLSNFSAFRLNWAGLDFDTSEHAYHYSRFPMGSHHREQIKAAPSAHEAFRYAQEHKADQRGEWDDEKVNTMRRILRAKAAQHEYVRRKLLQTGDRELVENSWRDPFWGWGENRDGLNMLGKLWMEVRAELRASHQRRETT